MSRSLAYVAVAAAVAALAGCPKPKPEGGGPEPQTAPDAGPGVSAPCRAAGEKLVRAESEASAGRLLAVRNLTEQAWQSCPSPESGLARAQALEALWLRNEAAAAYRDYAETGPEAEAVAKAAIGKLSALPAGGARANLEQVRKARKYLRVGEIRTNEKAYDRALEDFQTAFSLWGHPTCLVAMAATLTRKGDDAGARQMLARAVALAESTQNAAAKPQIDTLYFGAVNDMELDANGRIAVLGLASNAVLIWDLKGRRALHLLTGHEAPVNDVALSPKGDLVASVSLDGATVVWDVATGQELYRFQTVASKQAVAFHPDGSKVYSGGDDGVIRIHTLAEGAVDRYLLHHEGEIWAMDAVQVGERALLATGDSKNHVKVWQLDDSDTPADESKLLFELPGHTSSIWEVRFRPPPAIGSVKDVLLATSGHDKTARLWSIPLDGGKPKAVAVLKGHSEGIGALDFSPGGDQLATGSRDKSIRIWDIDSRKPLQVLDDENGHASAVRQVRYEPGLGDLLAVDEDGKILRWSPGSGKLLGRAAGSDWYLRWGALSPDGKTLAYSLFDGRVQLLEPSAKEPLRSIAIGSEMVDDLAFSRDGSKLATASKKLRLHDVATGKQLIEIDPPADPWGVALSPSGDRLIGVGVGGFVGLWSATDGSLVKMLAPGGGTEASAKAAFVDDDRAVVSTGGKHGRVHLWNLETGKPMRSHSLREAGWLLPVEVGPDRAWFAAAGEGTVVGRWRVDSGEALPPLTGSKAEIRGIGISPDGSRLAAVGDDRIVRIWNTETGALLSTHYQHRSHLRSAIFSRDGKQLYTADRSGVIAVHDLTGEQPVHLGTLYAGKDGAWVVASADGRVEDDPAGRGRASLAWRVGDVKLPAAVLWEARESPGLLRELFSSLATP